MGLSNEVKKGWDQTLRVRESGRSRGGEDWESGAKRGEREGHRAWGERREADGESADKMRHRWSQRTEVPGATSVIPERNQHRSWNR